MVLALGNAFIKRLRQVLGIQHDAIDSVVQIQLSDFEKAGEEEKASYWEKLVNVDELASRLKAAGIIVEEVEINFRDFEEWLKNFEELDIFYSKMGDVRVEKLMEHYLTMKHLDLRPSDTFMDVAAAGSPLSGALRKKGINAWSQDLSYPNGTRDYRIGGDAAHIPVEDGFADILALHCSFECFRGDADKGFAVEVSRVLKPGGRVGIIPLYLDTIHFVKTSPHCNKTAILVEKEATWLWRDESIRSRSAGIILQKVFSKGSLHE